LNVATQIVLIRGGDVHPTFIGGGAIPVFGRIAAHAYGHSDEKQNSSRTGQGRVVAAPNTSAFWRNLLVPIIQVVTLRTTTLDTALEFGRARSVVPEISQVRRGDAATSSPASL
jgi:hypothetical protein